MSAVAKPKLVETVAAAPVADPLARLREPFPAHQISKLPKPTKAQTDAVKADFKKGIRCGICGSWHHPDVVHLDYVGHAALTDRLLDTDPAWSWEPMAFRDGLPAFDTTGGLWIKLTVCGVSRLGYGHAAPKNGQDPGAREKEVIGDALRNAAMRFGAALDLWHKGDLHVSDDAADEKPEPPKVESAKPKAPPEKSLLERAMMLESAMRACADKASLDRVWKQGSRLCALLDTSEPERLVELIDLNSELQDDLEAAEARTRQDSDFRAEELEGAFQ